jgi:hypothetical protein
MAWGADQTMAVLASRRQVVAIFNSLLLALAVLLIRQLFGSGVAWVAGFLLVFDPFLLTESRAVRTEGLLTGFSALALLSLLLYYIKRRMRYAALAGVLTGLALLSKVSASVLLPVGALIFVSGPLTDKTRASKDRWRDIGLGLLIWGGTLLLTIVVLWPALWVTPVEVARKMFDYVAYRAVEGEGGGSSSFFLGAPRDYADLGPLFYPAVLLFRTTPVILGGLGLLAILIWQAAKWPGRKKASLGLLLLYLVLYLALITRSVLKFERYVIPMLPALDLMAAAGLVLAWQWLTRRLSRLGTLGWVPALAILVSQMAWVLPTHPYYYSYWNPLSGGIQQAVHVLPVGVGYEGSDQAAAYLNSLPDAGTLKVASAISGKIRPLLEGATTIPMTNLDGEWYLADYTFIYISQLQRGKHDAEIIDYLKRKPLLFSFSLSGLDYGWIYRGPGAQYFGGDTKLEGRATLHAYDLSATQLNAGEVLTSTIYFRNEGQRPSDRFYVRIADADDYVWAQDSVAPRPGFEEAFRTRKAVVEGEAHLALPVGMPPGHYFLKMGYEDAETGALIGRFVLPGAADDVVVKLAREFPPVGAFRPPIAVNQVFQNELSLLGYDLSTDRITPGQSLQLTLFWQALADVSHDYVIDVQVLDVTGSEVLYWLGRPVRSGYSTDQWQARQLVQDPWRVDVPPDMPPGDYGLGVTLFDASTQAEVGKITLGEMSIVGRE